MSSSVLVFFYISAYHRDIHSFPTRRSSDLRMRAASRDSRSRIGSRPSLDGVCSLVPAPPVVTRQRSEEHTSELQSPYDLVCRLLLEKKKMTASSPIPRTRESPQSRSGQHPC